MTDPGIQPEERKAILEKAMPWNFKSLNLDLRPDTKNVPTVDIGVLQENPVWVTGYLKVGNFADKAMTKECRKFGRQQ